MLSPFSLFRRLIRIVFLFFLLLSKQNSSQHHQSKIASTRFTDRFQSLGWEKKKEKRKISSSIIRSLRYSWNSTHSRRSSSLQSSSRTTGWHVAPRNYSTLHTFLRIHRSFLTFHEQPRYASSQGDSEMLRPGIVRLLEAKLPRVRVTVRCSSYK